MSNQPDIRSGLQHHQAGRFSEAESIYRRILQAEPNHADALHLLGLLAFQTGHHDHAIELIRRAIKLIPTATNYRNNLARVLSDRGLLDEAIAECRESIALNTGNADGYTNLGVALLKKGATGNQSPPSARSCPFGHGIPRLTSILPTRFKRSVNWMMLSPPARGLWPCAAITPRR